MKEYRLGIEATLEILGGKWKALIICHLMSGKKRTSELERLIPEASQKVLIQQLRELEKDNIVIRKNYQEMPPRVDYSLTEYGKTANELVDTMCRWGSENIRLRVSQGESLTLLEGSITENCEIDKN